MDELHVLKALPDIEDEVKELLTIEHLLSELNNLQVAFTVRQRQPKTLDVAVACTLETGSYLLRGAKDTCGGRYLVSNPKSVSPTAVP